MYMHIDKEEVIRNTGMCTVAKGAIAFELATVMLILNKKTKIFTLK